jgi:hypothetical protein
MDPREPGDRLQAQKLLYSDGDDLTADGDEGERKNLAVI